MEKEVKSLKQVKAAIIGGGVSGSTAAVHLSELGISVALLEKGDSLVNGPPICHLHAGGNLYREISSKQCLELLEQSITTVRLFPHTVNRRPTVIATPMADSGDPEQVLNRLDDIKHCYEALIAQDGRNEVLGKPCNYFKSYTKSDLLHLQSRAQPSSPESFDDWIIPFAQHANLDSLKYPVIAVQEYGWSVFRLAASAALILDKVATCEVMTNSALIRAQYDELGWLLTYQDSHGEPQQIRAEYLINACGYQTGSVDDEADYSRDRMVEFKAAYLTKWDSCNQEWPEVIFHGPRGTPQGMAQLTPYANGVFQLHGMTEDITLFKDGLVSSTRSSAQPVLPSRLLGKISSGWPDEVMSERTSKAIHHMGQFIPSFDNAKMVAKPLFGAQQIPGNDATLRSTDVSFESQNYARIEVVKGSSALEAAKKLVSHWQLSLPNNDSIEEQHPVSLSLDYQQVEEKARQLADERAYPQELALRTGSVQ
ncbi:FAD-dependent oxidoreductase [Vibrio sp. ZSDE26]|uniref:FAD-dependent oxidoreductase n=1 Tax=Vibrio amylolyticus TaxID=2847292 RepID=A0A9X1XKM0_9VIBR|nr:FAD-dependent oxidoreductase [Vibrio amylolyticus]MCK6263895.1 FAD-dependent oxidoreductase [Vibrio amylolyticus]